jgi:hypothetical protein
MQVRESYETSRGDTVISVPKKGQYIILRIFSEVMDIQEDGTPRVVTHYVDQDDHVWNVTKARFEETTWD